MNGGQPDGILPPAQPGWTGADVSPVPIIAPAGSREDQVPVAKQRGPAGDHAGRPQARHGLTAAYPRRRSDPATFTILL